MDVRNLGGNVAAVLRWLLLWPILTSIAISGQVPFVNARNHTERCQAIQRWAEDINIRSNTRIRGLGQDLNLYVAGYHDAIGKPFEQLSSREVKSILSALRSCTKEPAMSYLIRMFDFKSRKVGSRDLELWTEAVAKALPASATPQGSSSGALDPAERAEIRNRLEFAKRVVAGAKGKVTALAKQEAAIQPMLDAPRGTWINRAPDRTRTPNCTPTSEMRL